MMKQVLHQYLNKQLALYIFGIAILSFGISFIVNANLGAAPWDLLSIGLAEKTSLTIGNWQIINNIIMIVLTKILFKDKWNIICLIPGIIQGLFIDLIGFYIVFDGLNAYLSLLIGCLLSGIGLAIYMNQGFSANAIDNFTFMLYTKWKLTNGIAKVVSDAFPLVLVLCLQMPLQLATLLVYLLVPLFMQKSYQILKPIIT